MSNLKTYTVKWYQSLSFQGLLGLGFITLWLFAGIVIVINTRGKTLLANQSSRLIETTGNKAVSQLNARSLEIAALARTLAITSENLPKSATTFKQFIPQLLNFQGDLAVAGGGIWPEPYTFNSSKEKSSFFWGRDKSGKLKFYDDYNQFSAGYHREEWYVPAQYTQPNKCFWSQAYIDPYSHQPMVTCSVPTFNRQRFSGVATIDLSLEGLQSFSNYLQKETGGYVFVLDRNNKFITVPQYKANYFLKINRFVLSDEMAVEKPLFLPLAQALERMNEETIFRARKMPKYSPLVAAKIDSGSYQIGQKEAQLILAAISDPLKPDRNNTNLYMKVQLENDFLLKQPSTAFIFHVPNSYWKLVIVKPNSEINAVTSNIVNLLISYVVITILIVMMFAYLIFNRFLLEPLSQTTNAVKLTGELVADKKINQISAMPIKNTLANEIGLLAQVFNFLATEVVQQHKQLEQANIELEDKVIKRTLQLKQANSEITALNQRLETENMRLSAELEITRQLQQMILPKTQELEQIQDLEIATFMQPAEEVGGDYYDILKYNEQVIIGIGDVTGHGLESGVLTIMLQTAIRTLLANSQTNAKQFLNTVNQTIYNNIERMNIDKNVSLALLDYQAGKLKVSGQHEEIIIARSSGVERIDTIDLGFPLGLEPDITEFINQTEIALSTGDVVVLYTDGITEAENELRIHYGLERLCEIIERNWQRSPEEIKQAIITDLMQHIGKQKIYDDITLLVLKQK